MQHIPTWFVTLEESGSFARAARRIGVSRSTLMRRLDALEARLGIPLVQRAGARIAFTEAGRQYAQGLRPLLRDLGALEQQVLAQAGQLRGSLRVWLPILGTSEILAPALADFAQRHPGIHIELQLGRDVRQLQLGSFDVALQMGYRANLQLQARTVMREALILVASPRYLEEYGAPETVAELARHRGILRRDLEGKLLSWRTPDGTAVPHPPAAATVNSVGFAFALAQQGLGIARVPRLLASPSLQRGDLVHLLPEVHTEEPVSFVFPPDPPRITQVFVDHATQWFEAP